MKTTVEQLKTIEEMAELQFEPAEIALIVDLDADQFQAAVGNVKDSIGAAFHRGRLRSEAELRRAIFKQAAQGSTPAQRQAMSLVRKAKRLGTTSKKR